MSTRILEDRFELEQLLHRTDFSTVYLACDRHFLHRPHCLITAVPYRQREIRHRLEHEAHALEQLSKHPQIPDVLAYFYQSQTGGGTFYLAQERIAGHPLSDEIVPPKPLSASYVTKLLQDVLSILAFVHDRGSCHQSLHPQHLIRQDMGGQIFITQFGSLSKLARSSIGPDGDLTSSVPVGLQPYIAPEQRQPAYTPHPTSDLYALGLIAIEALTGQRHHHFAYDPIRGLQWREAYACQQGDGTNLPLAEFIDRLIRHDWRDRFPHARAALDTLRAHAARQQIASDSRLPTVIAAPGERARGDCVRSRSPRAAGPGHLNQGRIAQIGKTHRISSPNPYLYKLLAGSVAALLALGVAVKTYQWGEYRLSRLPQTWQAWQKPETATYPEATARELTPLMADGSILLRPAAAQAFWKMAASAQADGVRLYPLSGYRPSAEIAPPAAEANNLHPSDYPTGYALDIGGAEAATDRQLEFAKTAAYQWLQENASTYGFELSVRSAGLLGARSDEPWHWRYVGDRQSQDAFESP